VRVRKRIGFDLGAPSRSLASKISHGAINRRARPPAKRTDGAIRKEK
jgi:hypothetical protein